MRDEYGRFVKGIVPWNKGMKGLYIAGSEKGWLRKGHKWPKEIEEKMLTTLREKSLLKPNLEMNESLAYIIGLLKGDGHVGHYSRSYRISLDSTNEKIAINLFKALKDIRLNPFLYKHNPTNGIGKQKQIRVIANSKIFYEWYKRLTAEKLKILFDSKEKAVGFIRGFYEAEGSIYRYKNSTIVISISNTDLELIELVKFLLEKLGLNFRLNGPYKNNRLGGYNAKPIYRIQTGSKKYVFGFLDLIKPSVKILS